MVARTPPRLKKMVAPIDPAALRETVNKVDRCVARLQELHHIVVGDRKDVSGVNLRCKQDSRNKNGAYKKSPRGKFPAKSTGEWQRMSLPAQLVDETVGEIIQKSQFARDLVETIGNKTRKVPQDNPKTPISQRKIQRSEPENTELRCRRNREKQITLQSIRSESNAPSLLRARSRINFKVVSPAKKREIEGESSRNLANRVSPRNRPWAKKTVLFPNPLFITSPSQQQKFGKTRSPMIGRRREIVHKFLVKSPTKIASKVNNGNNKNSAMVSLSPTRVSKEVSAISKLRRSLSPARLANRFTSPLKRRKGLP